jgi:hypothetical protein
MGTNHLNKTARNKYACFHPLPSCRPKMLPLQFGILQASSSVRSDRMGVDFEIF